MALTGEIAELRLTLESSPSNIILVESFVEDLRNTWHIPDEVYGNMLVCVTEAVNNAIVHGNKSNEAKAVHVSLRKERNRMTFLIQDEGPGFDYNNLPDPTSPENIESLGGRGIFLMKHLSDLVVFSNSGSNVEIQFKL